MENEENNTNDGANNEEVTVENGISSESVMKSDNFIGSDNGRETVEITQDGDSSDSEKFSDLNIDDALDERYLENIYFCLK